MFFYLYYFNGIMYGYCTDGKYTTPLTNGQTDGVIASSGSMILNNYASGLFAMKYRKIESLWGNINQFIDGVYINKDTHKIIAEYRNYWIQNMGYDNFNNSSISEVSYAAPRIMKKPL